MNRIPIPDTDLYIWDDGRSWVVGTVAKCDVTKSNPAGLRTKDCTYHATQAQACAEVFERQLRVRSKDAKTLESLRLSHAKTVKWLKGLFPGVK